MEVTEERYLLQLIAGGDTNAFSLLYRQYRNKIYTHALAFTRSVTDAEDITADCFLKLWKARERLPQVESLPDYLFILVRNQLISSVRKRSEEVVTDQADQLLQTHLRPDEQYQYSEARQLLMRAIDRLPSQQKQVFLLNRLEGLTYEQIAAQLSLTRRQVHYMMVQALAWLREYAGANGLLPVLLICVTGYVGLF